jgi:hypothetical protein
MKKKVIQTQKRQQRAGEKRHRREKSKHKGRAISDRTPQYPGVDLSSFEKVFDDSDKFWEYPELLSFTLPPYSVTKELDREFRKMSYLERLKSRVKHPTENEVIARVTALLRAGLDDETKADLTRRLLLLSERLARIGDSNEYLFIKVIAELISKTEDYEEIALMPFFYEMVQRSVQVALEDKEQRRGLFERYAKEVLQIDLDDKISNLELYELLHNTDDSAIDQRHQQFIKENPGFETVESWDYESTLDDIEEAVGSGMFDDFLLSVEDIGGYISLIPTELLSEIIKRAENNEEPTKKESKTLFKVYDRFCVDYEKQGKAKKLQEKLAEKCLKIDRSKAAHEWMLYEAAAVLFNEPLADNVFFSALFNRSRLAIVDKMAGENSKQK